MRKGPNGEPRVLSYAHVHIHIHTHTHTHLHTHTRTRSSRSRRELCPAVVDDEPVANVDGGNSEQTAVVVVSPAVPSDKGEQEVKAEVPSVSPAAVNVDVDAESAMQRRQERRLKMMDDMARRHGTSPANSPANSPTKAARSKPSYDNSGAINDLSLTVPITEATLGVGADESPRQQAAEAAKVAEAAVDTTPTTPTQKRPIRRLRKSVSKVRGRVG